MSGKNWKRVQPTCITHALRLCKDYAKEVHNRSVERIADLIGVSADLLYKWLANGRMPVSLIPAFELACGIDFASRWLVTSGGKLVVAIPTGRTVKATDVQQLQELLNAAVGGILRFADGKAEAGEVLASINHAMSGLAWHHGNVEKHLQPELEFGEEK